MGLMGGEQPVALLAENDIEVRKEPCDLIALLDQVDQGADNHSGKVWRC
jgi:hypothetical protein